MSLISVCLFPAVRVSLFVYMEGSGVWNGNINM
jgi:hypothetical protein